MSSPPVDRAYLERVTNAVNETPATFDFTAVLSIVTTILDSLWYYGCAGIIDMSPRQYMRKRPDR